MGLFCLVLHTHLPYVRRNGTWPSGEDFFHQAAVESYLPLLAAFRRLAERDLLRDGLTLGLSPMVAHQMADPWMLRELGLYIGRWQLRAWRQAANYDGVFREEFRDLAAFYTRFAREQEATFDSAPSLADGFAALERAGAIEIAGGPATHAYLPLVREPALLDAQLGLGLAEHERRFGRRPPTAWLPECAYTPGLEERLGAADIRHAVVDGPTMLRGGGSTFAPARIAGSDVVAFARDLDVAYRVWSPTGGYPTGRWYRDFYAYDMEGGFKDWRVTSRHKPIAEKRPYEPARAREAARRDAEDFAALIASALDTHRRETGRDGVVVAAYDTELFGHWWFEGPVFLERLYEVLAETPGVEPASLSRAAAVAGPFDAVELPEGTWGFRKDTRSWVDEETAPMWEALDHVEAETVRLAEKFAGTREPGRRAALAQNIREAMLLQASDWPFMVLRGRNPAYAWERFEGHRTRWEDTAAMLRSDMDDALRETRAAALFEIDNVLPGVDGAALAP